MWIRRDKLIHLLNSRLWFGSSHEMLFSRATRARSARCESFMLSCMRSIKSSSCWAAGLFHVSLNYVQCRDQTTPFFFVCDGGHDVRSHDHSAINSCRVLLASLAGYTYEPDHSTSYSTTQEFGCH